MNFVERFTNWFQNLGKVKKPVINDAPLFILVTRGLERAKVTKIHYKPKIVTEVAIINEDD